MVKDDYNYAQKRANRGGNKLVVAAFLVSGCTSTSISDSTAEAVWLGREEALAKDKKMLAKGMMPLTIDCMMDTTVRGNFRPSYFVKISYGPRSANKNWRWGVGEADEMKVFANTAGREGLKLVRSRKMFDPNSGTHASCALWHS
jgi:hypothetical protein